MNQQPVQQPQQPGVAKWLWIVLIIVVILGGAFFAWYYLMGPGKATTAITETTTTTTPTTTKETLLDGYSKYSNDQYDFSFQYPTKWADTKKETTTADSSDPSKDLVFKVTFSDPDMKAKIDCANNEFQNYKDATPTKATCDPILSQLTAEQKKSYTGPKSADNIFVRVYNKGTAFTNLTDWLTKTYKVAGSELSDYVVGKAITLGGESGFYSSIGCCAGSDRNYVITKGDYIYDLGTNYFTTSITDTEMPATFLKVVDTFKVTNADKIETTSADSTAIIEACLAANEANKSLPGFECVVVKKEGNYATGTAGGTGGGAHWYAKKVNDKWTMVVKGTQDTPECTDVSDFPKSIAPTCI